MTRHTVMVVGQTGGGKSVILNTLARAETKMGKRTSLFVLNPKVSRPFLLAWPTLLFSIASAPTCWTYTSTHMVQVPKAANCPLSNILSACVQAISVAELYGTLDPDTRDWTDGLLSNIFREINKPLLPGKVWKGLSSCGPQLAVKCQQSSCPPALLSWGSVSCCRMRQSMSSLMGMWMPCGWKT